jgi:hypothetical protein
LSLAAVLASPACRQRVAADGLAGGEACAALDSLLASAGPVRPFVMSGHARLDVEQFRFRGRFRLEQTDLRGAVIEFSGSTLFGGHREDLLVSLADDTLRVFDRERGRFYEGSALDDLIWDGTRTRADWATVVAEVLMVPRRCSAMSGLVLDEDGARGVEGDKPFRIVVDGERRVESATWPDPVAGGTFDDRLEIEYQWRDGVPAEITARLPARGWRLRFSQDK